MITKANSNYANTIKFMFFLLEKWTTVVDLYVLDILNLFQ